MSPYTEIAYSLPLPLHIALWLEASLMVLTVTVLVWALLFTRNERGGWYILSAALPLLIACVSFYYLYCVHIFPEWFTGKIEVLSERLEGFTYTRSFILMVGLIPGLIGLWCGIWLIVRKSNTRSVTA